MFLRTRCDKELFLSLHDRARMGGAGLPAPVKRPGIGVLAVEGREFEAERNEQLVRLFPGITQYRRANNKFSDMDLRTTLVALQSAPALVLQGRFSVAAQQGAVLTNIGIGAADIPLVPELTDFIPDVVLVRAAVHGDYEVRPDGSRAEIFDLAEDRLALSIYDVKHTAEANPSYCAEIAMYALMLANWLELHPELHRRYFVAADAKLWTRVRQGDSGLDSLERQGGAHVNQLLEALARDSEDAQLRFYLSAVRTFFEDVVRVLRVGAARPDGWVDLDWHVSGSCSSCDWLGDRRHLGANDRLIADANPSHYCMPAAAAGGHLCLVPGITRGAKKVLQQHTVLDTAALAGAVGHPAFQQHTLLKREARTLPARSAAIASNNLTRDTGSVIASLVASAHLLVYASVNFDSSSGLLTGLSLSGVATNFTPGERPRRFQPTPFVVDQKTLAAEWVALEGFLTQIASYIDVAETLPGNTGSVTGQIHFWEQRQLQELCNAMGRHLPRVMALSVRKARALAWVFSPDEMIARPESLEAAIVVAIDDIVRRLVFAPTRHVITLFDTAEHYHRGPAFTVRDSYYREYLSNAIPRERIYEIWSGASQVRRGAGNTVPRNTVIAQYSDALNKQSQALEAVCEKLREDYRGHFRARATRIPTSIPQGARDVAFDGKLWLWWDQLGFNASQLEAHLRLSMDADRLEASYEAIVLRNGVHVRGDEYEFDVAPTSTEAKFKEDSTLTLGKVGHPGVPLQHASRLLRAGAPAYQGNPDLLARPLWSVLQAKLLSFDRANGRARVAIAATNEPLLFHYLAANSSMPLLDDVFLVEGKKPKLFNWAEHSVHILNAIGSPAISVPDPNAARAMGIAPTARRAPPSPPTPAARVLWEPSAVQGQSVVSSAHAAAAASRAAARDALNLSQQAAVAHALEHGLTVIWGPPGTGKTKTLAAMLHAMVAEAVQAGRALRVLVTGPTYKAVEEVVHRAVRSIGTNSAAACTVFMGYAAGRAVPPRPSLLPAHISYREMFFANGDVDLADCLIQLGTGQQVVVVGCQVRQARQFARRLTGGNALHPVFDVVVIDESSQVPVSHAVAAFSGLTPNSRLVIAGDHLQMPPITAIEPPADVSYMVGSIQTYLQDRPFPSPVRRCVLERNYRSAEHIVEFARRIGYPSSLQAVFGNTALHVLAPPADEGAFRAIHPNLPWSPAFPAVVDPVRKALCLLHEDDISSQGNRYEAQIVASLVWMLRATVSAELDGRGPAPANHRPPTPQEFWSECVGIVTPHRAQRALVVQELCAIWPGEQDLIDDAVDTVERFQGGERHTILVTFGVADVDVIGGEESFLMQLERTNVAISRAMAKCVVVMPTALAAHIPEDKRALETAFALKDYVEEFCGIRVPTTLTGAGSQRAAEIRYHV
ncbi:MAG: AAA domain-containing protein [Pseudomonadota bacterium]|nr:AAA domain-containing protein [Pseudomonadota bacterium]